MFTEPIKRNEANAGIDDVIFSASPEIGGSQPQTSPPPTPEARAEATGVASTSTGVHLVDQIFKVMPHTAKIQENISDYKKGEECRICFMKDHFSDAQDLLEESESISDAQMFQYDFCFQLPANTMRDLCVDHWCNLCQKAFKSRTLLQRHVTEEMTNCDHCGDPLRGCEAKSVHEKKKQQCSFCGESFDCAHLKNHMRDSTACKQFLAAALSSNDAVGAMP
jgi:hypothetical protein